MAAAGRGAAPLLNVADVFSADAYTGNGGTKIITNGVNLSDEGGLVWTKCRTVARTHCLQDTLRGVSKELYSEDAAGQVTLTSTVTSFNTDGHTLGNNGKYNDSSDTYIAWTFRRAPKFFDVVTWTGNDVAGRAIPHGLGIAPGLVIVKCISTDSTQWSTAHRSLWGSGLSIVLNTAAAAVSGFNSWFVTVPDAVNFYVGSDSTLNWSGRTYIAYLFAHDISASGIVQCGSYVGNGSATGPVIDLGWEPQFLLTKKSSATEVWAMHDSARGVDPTIEQLQLNNSNTEVSPSGTIDFTSIGFQIKSTDASLNTNAATYIYMAIRAEGA